MPADLFRMSDYTLIVQPHGDLGTEPPGELWKYQDRFKGHPWCDPRGIERDANEIMRAFPKLLPIPAAEWLTKLEAVITLESNHTNWMRLIELVALIGGNPENSTPEENAIVRLVVGFDCLSAQVDAELRGTLQEAKEIMRRVWDRTSDAARAGQLEIKGRNVSNLTALVTIPASLVTADRIWSLLRSSKLEIEGQHFVDVQIGPPESSETVHETKRAEEPEEFVEHWLKRAFPTPAPAMNTSTPVANNETSVAKSEAAEASQEKHPVGAPSEWDWKDMIVLLQQRQAGEGRFKNKTTTFKNTTAFKQFIQKHVQRVDGSNRGDGPNSRTVDRAITTHKLAQYATFEE
jgi:hypothetical protein